MIGKDIEEAVKFLNAGQAVAIPTETVYGLAANALDELAVAKVFEIKERPKFNPLILHVPSINDAKKYTLDWPEDATKLAENFWPGPLTLLLPKNELITDLVTAGSERVAVRVPNHQSTLNLLNKLAFPLVAPSANPFQYLSPTTAKHVDKQLGEKVPYILDGGPCQVGIESTIIGFEEGKVVIYRLGGIPREKIEKTLEKEVEIKNFSEQPKAPGMMRLHYAPKKKIIIGNPIQLSLVFRAKRMGILTFSRDVRGKNIILNKVLSRTENFQEAAANFFNYLHELEAADIEVILAEKLPGNSLGKAINDRLERAAGK